jgi:carboxymethylenebutenolidase
MKLRFALVGLLASLSFSAFAQDWAKEKVNASPRHLEWVDLKHGNKTVKAFVAYPEVKEKVPVIVMIHEIFGLSDWAMLMADQFAAAGYIVVAPDFLSGKGPNGGGTSSLEATAVRTAMSALTPDEVDADLHAAVDYAKKIPSGNGKVVVGGFCWGGTQTFRFATKRADLSAALVFYGSGPTDEADLKKITAPVYGFYGENDNRVNATIPEIEKIMKTNGKKYEPIIYTGGGHGFMRAGDQPNATEGNAKARAAAWTRLMTILGGLK